MKLFVLLIGVLAFTVLNVHGGHINSTLTHRIQSILAAEQFTDIPLNDTPSSPPQAVSDIEMQAERIVHRRHAPMSIKKKVVAVIFAFLLSVSSLYLLAVPKPQIQQVEYKHSPQPYKFIELNDKVICNRETKQCSIKFKNLDPNYDHILYTAKNDNGRGDKVKLTEVAKIDPDKCDFDKNVKPEVDGEEICKQIVKGIDENSKAETIEVDSGEIIFGSESDGTEDYAIVEEAKHENEHKNQQELEHVHIAGPREQPVEHNQPTIKNPTVTKVEPVNEYQHKLEERVKKLGIIDFKHGDLYGKNHQRAMSNPTVNEDEKAKRLEKLLGTLEDHKHPSLVDKFKKEKGNFNKRSQSDPARNKVGKAKDSDSNGPEQKLEKHIKDLALSDFKHGDIFAKNRQRAMSNPNAKEYEKAKRLEKFLGTLEDHKHPSLVDQYNKDKGSLNQRAKSDPIGNQVGKANGPEESLKKLAISDFKHGELLGRKGGFKQRTMNIPSANKVKQGKGSDFNGDVEEKVGAENGKNQEKPILTGRKLAAAEHNPVSDTLGFKRGSYALEKPKNY